MISPPNTAPGPEALPHSVIRSFRGLWLLVAVAATMLSGCNLFDDAPKSTIAKPATLSPESDAFLEADRRTYYWTDELQRNSKADSVLGIASFSLVQRGDTVIGGQQKPFIDVSEFFTSSAPAALFSRLGFRPEVIHYDTALVTDPGLSYPFPETPTTSWRLDSDSSTFRFVRVLTGTRVLEQGHRRIETWAFAESTWWDGEIPVLMGTGTTWMGYNGLVRHESYWPNFITSTNDSGTLVRTIVAQ